LPAGFRSSKDSRKHYPKQDDGRTSEPQTMQRVEAGHTQLVVSFSSETMTLILCEVTKVLMS